MLVKVKFVVVAIITICALLWLAQRHQNSSRSRQKISVESQPGTMLLGAVGDILLHREHHELGFKHGSFRPLWAPIDDILGMPDVLYGNFEGTSSPRSHRTFPSRAQIESLDGCKGGNTFDLMNQPREKL